MLAADKGTPAPDQIVADQAAPDQALPTPDAPVAPAFTVTPAEGSVQVTLSLDSSAPALAAGDYNGQLSFSAGGTTILRSVSLAVLNPGKTPWVQVGTNPVLSKASSGAWDGVGVAIPMVLKEGPSFSMRYVGENQPGGLGVGRASSTDGKQ
jgi:hypothetical protein